MKAKAQSKSADAPFQMSLRVRHPSMDPAELSRELRMEAEHAYRAGDPRPVSAGRPGPSLHVDTYWIGLLDPRGWPPDIAFPDHERLKIAAERLRASALSSFTWALSLSISGFFNLHAPLLKRIRSEGGQVSLLVALSASKVGSFTLEPELTRAFGELGITVEFEFTDD